jgi:hypothetical protein
MKSPAGAITLRRARRQIKTDAAEQLKGNTMLEICNLDYEDWIKIIEGLLSLSTEQDAREADAREWSKMTEQFRNGG